MITLPTSQPSTQEVCELPKPPKLDTPALQHSNRGPHSPTQQLPIGLLNDYLSFGTRAPPMEPSDVYSIQELDRSQLIRSSTLGHQPEPIQGDLLLQLLREFLGNQEGVFKSPRQREALHALITNQHQSLVLILPTGGGKSTLFLLAASLATSKTSILVVPLVALRQDFIQRGKALGLQIAVWDDLDHTQQEALVQGQYQGFTGLKLLITSIESAASEYFYHSMSRMTNRIDRIIFDEAHLIHLAANYRSVMHQLKLIPTLCLPLVLASATITSSTLVGIQENLLIRQPHIIRDPIRVPNIYYGVQTIPTACQDHLLYVMEFIHQFRADINNPSARVIIYFLSKREVNRFSDQFPSEVSYYHSDLDEAMRASQLDHFNSGQTSILAGTSAISAGYDFRDITLVVYLHGAWSFNDFIQGSGRLARQPGSTGYCIVLAKASGFNPIVKEPPYIRADSIDRQAMRDFLEEKHCRRRIINQIYDDIIMTCLPNDLKCDLCQSRYHGFQLQSQITRDYLRRTRENEAHLVDYISHWVDAICLFCFARGKGMLIFLYI